MRLQCPQCGHTIPGVQERPVGALTCPGCGGSFPVPPEVWRNAVDLSFSSHGEVPTESTQSADSQAELQYIRAGVALVARQQYEQAIEEFTRAIGLNPHSPQAYNNRGYAHVLKKEFSLAIPDFNRAIQLDPGYAAAYNNRASAYLSQQRFELAIRDSDAALALNAGLALAWHTRGLAAACQGRFDQAIIDFDAALRINPALVNVLQNRGVAHLARAHHQQARADFTEAIRLHPGNARAYHQRSLADAALNNPDAALADHLEAIRLGLRVSETYPELVRQSASAAVPLRNGSRQLEQALRGCEASAWKDWTWLRVLAAAHAESVHFLEAIAWIEKALILAPQEGRSLCLAELQEYRKQSASEPEA
jgi:tetratricopeptide (TPR) repeat protein